MNLRRFRLTSRLLPVNLHVLIGPADDARAWCSTHYGEPIKGFHGASAAGVHPNPKGVGFLCYLWMPYFREGSAFDAGKLAHEALHVAWQLLAQIGIADEETHCYLVQWIVEEVTRRCTPSTAPTP